MQGSVVVAHDELTAATLDLPTTANWSQLGQVKRNILQNIYLIKNMFSQTNYIIVKPIDITLRLT